MKNLLGEGDGEDMASLSVRLGLDPFELPNTGAWKHIYKFLLPSFFLS